jgi:hypothetical protein
LTANELSIVNGGIFNCYNVTLDYTNYIVPGNNQIGQIVDGVINPTTNLVYTSGYCLNNASISLTPGTYIINGTVSFFFTNTLTTNSQIAFAISNIDISNTDIMSLNNTSNNIVSIETDIISIYSGSGSSSFEYNKNINKMIHILSNTTYYLVAQINSNNSVSINHEKISFNSIRIG